MLQPLARSLINISFFRNNILAMMFTTNQGDKKKRILNYRNLYRVKLKYLSSSTCFTRVLLQCFTFQFSWNYLQKIVEW